MTSAGYVPEGRLLRRKRATFGFLICVTVLCIVLSVVGFGLLGWYLVNHRDVTIHLTIFYPVGNNTRHTTRADSTKITYHNIDKDTVDVHIPANHQPSDNDRYHKETSQSSSTSNIQNAPTWRVGVQTTQPQTLAHASTSLPVPIPPLVTGEDLSQIIQSMWDRDINRLDPPTGYELDIQGRIFQNSNRDDHANRKLFRSISVDVRRISRTHRRFVRLLGTYHQGDHVNGPTANDVSSFLEAVTTSDIMRALEQFLRSKELLREADSFADVLHAMWFEDHVTTDLHVTKSGFHHVFVGETDDQYVSGFYNWIQFYLEEKKDNVDYYGYLHTQEPAIVSVQFSWHGKLKSMSSFFVGTSPEFDMAMYTLCAFTRPNEQCTLSLNGRTVRVQTRVRTHDDGVGVETAYLLTV